MSRIILTGPESTGKSHLTEQLALHFGGVAIPEYAREYIGTLGRPYTSDDVLAVARWQVAQMERCRDSDQLFFFDTGLVITKIWLKVVFGVSVPWIESAILQTKGDLYLLCYPDIPWVPDPLRENGGVMRMKLYEMYLDVLDSVQLNYRVISGEGDTRVGNAVSAVNEMMKFK